MAAKVTKKRPRPIESSSSGDEPIAIRKKEKVVAGLGSSPMLPVKALPESSAYRKSMFLSFLEDAFSQRIKGKNERYNEIVSQFRSLTSNQSNSFIPTPAALAATASSVQLTSWLEAMIGIVSKLDKSHTPLVETILAVPWATMSDSFVIVYIRFIGALVSARTEWLKSVLEKCVKGFKYRSNYTNQSKDALAAVTRRILYGRIHSLLRLLLSLIPTLAPSLSPLLAANFPSKRDTRPAQICYIDNLLALTEYCPALSEDVLALVVERALNIDVEIQGDFEDWEELEESVKIIEPGVNDIVDRTVVDDEIDSSSDEEEGFNLEDLESDDDDEPNPESDGEAAKKVAEAKKMKLTVESVRKGRDNAAKLDAILKVVFDHLAAAESPLPPPITIRSNGSTTKPAIKKESTDSTETTPTPETPISTLANSRRHTLFKTLLDIFDQTLLRTFKTRHVQFLLFYLCSLNTASCDQFIGVLLTRALFDTDAAVVTRVTASGYVASFIARAKFVDQIMTRKVVRLLCEFLESQMILQEKEKIEHLPVFYAISQAVFYIFCFRWKDLLDEGDEEEIGMGMESGRRWMMGLETLKKAIGSSFNPLKVCAQPVVNQFAAIAHKTNFHYCYALIDSNRRVASTRENFALPSTPLRSHSETAPALRPRLTSILSAPVLSTTPIPRQLLVAEEMDSFFPFDPLKLPLSSIYIDSIYREWIADDESDNSSQSTTDSSDSENEDSEVDTDEALPYPIEINMGLSVPGSKDHDDEQVVNSFEAMSLSPEDAFGGRARLSSSTNMPFIMI